VPAVHATRGAVEGRKAPARERGIEHGDGRSSEHRLRDVASPAPKKEETTSGATPAIASERSEYQALLEKEIGLVDQRVVELQNESARLAGAAKEKKERDLSAARGFRARLKQDLDEVERAGDLEWPELIERVDEDLEQHRPSALPRSFDKSYGI
jgi:hypothetical protein